MEKISVSDLSVGDWVHYDRNTDAVQIMGLYVHNNQECVAMSDSYYYPDGVIGFVEHIKPIPLTPEVLEKNGFTHDKWSKKIWRYEDEESEVVYYIENGVLEITADDCKINLVCTSVAELQQALRLAKVGKEIVL